MTWRWLRDHPLGIYLKWQRKLLGNSQKIRIPHESRLSTTVSRADQKIPFATPRRSRRGVTFARVHDDRFHSDGLFDHEPQVRKRPAAVKCIWTVSTIRTESWAVLDPVELLPPARWEARLGRVSQHTCDRTGRLRREASGCGPAPAQQKSAQGSLHDQNFLGRIRREFSL
jgi:hypothetical protein